MDLTCAKRLANSLVESEKAKRTPTPGGLLPTAFFQQSVNQSRAKETKSVDEMDDDDGSWSWGTRRTRKWSGSTGKSPGGTPLLQQRSIKPIKPGPSEVFTHRHTTPRFQSKNEGAFRSEIEVEIKTKDGLAFIGIVSRHEGIKDVA